MRPSAAALARESKTKGEARPTHFTSSSGLTNLNTGVTDATDAPPAPALYSCIRPCSRRRTSAQRAAASSLMPRPEKGAHPAQQRIQRLGDSLNVYRRKCGCELVLRQPLFGAVKRSVRVGGVPRAAARVLRTCSCCLQTASTASSTLCAAPLLPFAPAASATAAPPAAAMRCASRSLRRSPQTQRKRGVR